ncbi:MAG: SDR family NAD(P)-dependent oxidoreductase [Candidatus Accumulibacter sp.]|jgi:3-oxoacyl-[acyl-carrier protein] reductase|nr:SDR family NAD(P)-dependent oxidoreductase [Accumulibacter sp.]
MENRHLEGKTAWITGSSRGIGREIAARLARCGARVVLHGSSAAAPKVAGASLALPAIADEIRAAHGVDAMYVYGDLSQAAVVKTLAAQIRERFGDIDILVNNAGGDIGVKGVAAANAGKPERNDALFIGEDDLHTILERNLMTCILACREVVPGMIERKRGWVVNVGSVDGTVGNIERAIYSTAKAAVHEYTRCLAGLLRPHGVYANAVAPGGTLSERFKVSRPIDEAMMGSPAGGSLERYGWPLEIARAVEFLVSEGASYISGQVLRVDGGRQLWPA